MTTSPAAETSAARCPIPSPMADALTWPAIPDRFCDGDHRDNTGAAAVPVPAVVTGSFSGRIINREYVRDEQIAFCLACAALYESDPFVPDPLPSRPGTDAPVIPTFAEHDNYLALLGWQRDTETGRQAAIACKRDGKYLTEAENERTYAVGLPRPMVTVELGGHYVTDAAIEAHGFERDEYDVRAPKRLPTPWINGWHSAVDGDFYSFRADMQRAHEERLCCICGENATGSLAIAAAGGKRTTSAGWGHPRCVALAVRTCPHFTDPFPIAPGSEQPRFEIVAWRWDGDGVGVDRPEFGDLDPVEDDAEPLTWDELRAWAAEEPWG